jgi:hypothetical protein
MSTDNVGAQAAIAAYNLAFEVSPIILTGGIAASAQGGLLPIIAMVGELGLLASNPTQTSQFFATYLPLPGSTLISNQIGAYPFANQQVAANAIITQPLTLSMLMIAPVNQPGGYLSKLATFTALQGSLAQHNAIGGTYSVATPAFIYNNLIMINMQDVTSGEGNQRQIEWQLDFVQPLLTQQAAAAAQSSLLAKITSGGQITNASWSGSPFGGSPVVPGLSGAITQFGGALGNL